MADRPEKEPPELSDEELDAAEAQIEELIGDAPVPSQLTEFAITAFSFPRLDDELAELVRDSVAAPELETASRSAASSSRHIAFTQADLVLDLEWDSETRTLTGQVEAEGPARLIMHRVDSEVDVQLDAVGEFTITDVAAGSIRFSCSTADARLETDWFSL